MRGLACVILIVSILQAAGGVSITNVTIRPGNTVSSDEDVLIVCEAENATHLWWTRDGYNISGTSVNNTTIHLDLNEVSLNDTGNYSCHAAEDSDVTVLTETVVLTVQSEPRFLSGNGAEVKSGMNATLECAFIGYPDVGVAWTKDGSPVRESDRLRLTTAKTENPYVQVFRLDLLSVSKVDNGSYVCKGSNMKGSYESRVDLVVLDKPKIALDLIKGVSPESIFVNWTADDGNAEIKQFVLKYKRSNGEDWNEVFIPGDKDSFVVKKLENNTAYVFQATASNEIGDGEWTSLSAPFSTLNKDPFGDFRPVLTMSGSSKVSVSLKLEPPPAEVREFVDAFEIQAVDQDDPRKEVRVKNFVIRDGEKSLTVPWHGLMPGTSYVFNASAINKYTQLRGKSSKSVRGSTLDATSSPPENVRIECKVEYREYYLLISWDPPQEIGGRILKYQVRVMMSAIFNDENGRNQHTIDEMTQDTGGNDTKFYVPGIPYTNYSIQVTALTHAGPGKWSQKSKESQCFMPAGLPSTIPASKWRPLPHADDPDRRIFSLTPHRVSERNGPICCYRVVLVRIPVNVDALPALENVTLMSYREAHAISDSYGAYVAETFEPSLFPDEVILGDENPVAPAPVCKVCFSVGAGHRHSRSKKFASRTPVSRFRRRDKAFSVESLTTAVINPEDGALDSNASYVGFMEIIVQKSDGQAAVARSPYFGLALDDPEAPDSSAPGAASPSLGASEILPILLGILLGVMVVTLVFLGLCVVRNYSKLVAAGQGVEPSFSFSVRHMWASLRGHPEGIPLSQPPPPDRSPIPKSKLVHAFNVRHKDGDSGFRSEFELLPERFPDRTTKASDDLNNSGKNRYPDIKAYDQTRVTLSKTGTTEEHACSDYINANFVVGYKERKKFICAQGPLLGTVNDFWRMIWEYNVQLMIMLTNFEENRKVKCCWYWPEEGTETYGDVTVSCAAEKPYSDYVLRRLRAERGEGETKETREVAHYHYLVWKDFMAPEHPSGVLKFLKRINSVYTPDKGHILIHCSAGVGRTGTLVALDSLLQEINEEGKASVFNTVSELRHQRNYLVQSLKQYIFVYRGLMEYAQFGNSEVPLSELKETYKRMIRRPSMEFGNGKGISPMQEEFERLSEVVEDPKGITIATGEQNSAKNRSQTYVPFDQNRVILSPVFSRPDDTYINASFMQGYDHSMGFVIMQDPLRATRGDLWRLVLDHNVTSLVMLSECECEADLDAEGQEEDAMNALTTELLCPQYWPDSVDTEETYDHIKVSLTKIDTLPMFIKRTFTVTNTKNGDTAQVKQFQYLGWADSEYADPADKTVSTVPETTNGLLDLISQVCRSQETAPEAGIIAVHCRHGSERSSVFVCLSILLQQLRTESSVDVFQTVRNLRSQRPGMIQHLAQYEFLYKALVDYADSENA